MTPPPAAAAATPVRAPRRTAQGGGASGATRATRPAARASRAARSGTAAAPARRARRVSGPSASAASAVRARTYAPARGGALALPLPSVRLGLPAGGLLETLAGVTEHRFLDRLIRGRGWIGLVAFALIGIVAMQLWIVKLGVGIGRALEHEAFLQRENAALSVADTRLSAGERVEALAAARGMVAAAPGSVRFDASRGALDARQAAVTLAHDEQAHPEATASSASTASTSSAGSASSSTATAGSETESTGSSAASGESSTAESERAASTESPTASGEATAQAAPEASGSETSSESSGAAPAEESTAVAPSSSGEETTAGG